MIQYISKYRKIIFIIIFFFILWFLFTYKITEVPPGINGDEASIGFNAILISQTLRDENHRLLPLFFLTMGGRDWKQPVTIYSTAILFKIFGPSYTLLRLVSVLMLFISVGLLFLFLKDIFNPRLAIVGSILYLSSPIILIQSHLALENIALLPFIVFWFLMIYKYEKIKKNKYLIWAGLSLGVSFYSYNGMRLIVPILIFLSFGYIYFLNNFSFKHSVSRFKSFFLGLIPFLLLIPLAQIKFFGALFGNRSPDEIHSYQQFILPYISSFDPSFLFITGDTTPYHSTGIHGILLLATLPLFLAGLYYILKNKTSILILAVLVFFLSPLLYGFVDSIHRGSRLLILIPFYAIISTAGIKYILQINKKVIKTGILILIFGAILFNYVDFLKTYWFEYPNRVKTNFSIPLHEYFKKLSYQSNELGLNPFVENGLYNQNIEASKFFEKIYFSKPLKFWNIGQPIPPKSIIFVRIADGLNLEQKGFKRIDLGKDNYFSLILSE